MFAYNLISRGERYGLRIVGSLKSQPALNVLAIYEGTTRRDPVPGQELRAPDVIAVSLVEGRDKGSRVAQDHADAAPLASSRSG